MFPGHRRRKSASDSKRCYEAEGGGHWMSALPPIADIQAWWARVAYVFVGILLVIGFVKLRTRTLKKQKKKLESIVAKRTATVVEQKEEILSQNEELETTLEQLIAAQEKTELAMSKLRFAQFALDNTDNMAYWIQLKSGQILYANAAASNRLGWTEKEMIAKIVSDIDNDLSEDKWSAFAQQLKLGKPLEFQSTQKTKDGELFPVEIIAQHVVFGDEERIIAFGKDITERRKAEKELHEAKNAAELALIELQETQSQLVQSEKMASLGQLTAGVAHELNNPINFISTGVVGLKRDMEDIIELLDKYEQLDMDADQQKVLKDIAGFKENIDFDSLKGEIEQTLEDIKMGASRTTEIVKGLRSFSRLDSEDQVFSNIHTGLDDTIIILDTHLKNKVKIIKKYDKSIKEILCYPGQLNQVFMNLIVNAEQAITERGVIIISTKNLGDTVEINFKDDGVGMTDEVQKHIFDPFYTTKDIGEGTGLGMSISYGIIEKHNGTVQVKSEVGKGSHFTITLPVKT